LLCLSTFCELKFSTHIAASSVCLIAVKYGLNVAACNRMTNIVVSAVTVPSIQCFLSVSDFTLFVYNTDITQSRPVIKYLTKKRTTSTMIIVLAMLARHYTTLNHSSQSADLLPYLDVYVTGPSIYYDEINYKALGHFSLHFQNHGRNSAKPFRPKTLWPQSILAPVLTITTPDPT